MRRQNAVRSVDPFEPAVIGDVDGAVRAHSRAVGPTAELGDHFGAAIGEDFGQGLDA